MTQTRETIAGVILAGGLSRRMGGGDKAFRVLGGRTLLDHAIERLGPQVSSVAINANGDPHRFGVTRLPVIADATDAFAGPLAGILAGMTWAATSLPTARYIVTTPCDTPFFPENLVDAFAVAARDGHPCIVLARSAEGLHPVFGLWPVALANDLEHALDSGVRKILDWTAQYPTRTVTFPPAQIGAVSVDPFFNINTPEDLAEADDYLLGRGKK